MTPLLPNLVSGSVWVAPCVVVADLKSVAVAVIVKVGEAEGQVAVAAVDDVADAGAVAADDVAVIGAAVSDAAVPDVAVPGQDGIGAGADTGQVVEEREVDESQQMVFVVEPVGLASLEAYADYFDTKAAVHLEFSVLWVA